MKLRVTTTSNELLFDIPKDTDKSVVESSLIKDLNGNNLPFIIFTDICGQNTFVNKNNIISVRIETAVFIQDDIHHVRKI